MSSRRLQAIQQEIEDLLSEPTPRSRALQDIQREIEEASRVSPRAVITRAEIVRQQKLSDIQREIEESIQAEESVRPSKERERQQILADFIEELERAAPTIKPTPPPKKLRKVPETDPLAFLLAGDEPPPSETFIPSRIERSRREKEIDEQRKRDKFEDEPEERKIIAKPEPKIEPPTPIYRFDHTRKRIHTVRNTYVYAGRRVVEDDEQFVGEVLFRVGDDLQGLNLPHGAYVLPLHAGVIFNDYEFRSINLRNRTGGLVNAGQLLANIDDLRYPSGDIPGSDGEKFVVDANIAYREFYLEYEIIEPLVGGAKGKRKRNNSSVKGYLTADFTEEDDPSNNCLLINLKNYGDLPGTYRKGKPYTTTTKRCDSIRNEMEAALKLPKGKMIGGAEQLNFIAKVFGCGIKIVMGYDTIPDSQRMFCDRGGKYKCETKPFEIVVGVYGDWPEDMCIKVLLHDKHYTLVLDDNLLYSEVTGDIGQFTDDQIKTRLIEQGRYKTKKYFPKKKGESVHKYVVFDYETVHEGPLLWPYAVGYFVIDDFGITNYESFFDKVQLFYNFDHNDPGLVTRAMLNDLERRKGKNDIYTFITFNGSKFDNYFLADCLASAGENRINSIFLTDDGGIRDIRFGSSSTLDLAKIVASSLQIACDGFNTKPKKLEGYSHTDIQVAYEEGRLEEFYFAHEEQFDEYLKRDVLSTVSLACILNKEIKEVFKLVCQYNNLETDEEFGLLEGTKKATASSFAWAMANRVCELPKAFDNQEMDNFARDAIVAGRTQIYKHEKYNPTGSRVKITGHKLRMIDFVSLYPTSMAAPERIRQMLGHDSWGKYPTSNNVFPVKHFVKGEVGLYKVIIHSQPYPRILPLRDEKTGRLDWEYKGEFTCNCTHMDLILLEKYGGKFTVIEGYLFLSADHGIFAPYINALAAIKNQEDILKKAYSPDYNEARRELVKLLMNGLSGKVTQRNFDEYVEIVQGLNDKAKLYASGKFKDNYDIKLFELANGYAVISGKIPDEKVYNPDKAYPSYLAVFIYSYSRALLYEIMCRNGILYSDTDSGLFVKEDYDKIMENYSLINCADRDKLLGDVDEELGEYHESIAYLIAPKDYCVLLYGEDGNRLFKKNGKERSKIRGKGVKNNDVLITYDELNELKSKDIDIQDELAEIYRGNKGHKKIAEDPVAFFEAKLEGDATAITSQLRKSYKQGSFFVKQLFGFKTFADKSLRKTRLIEERSLTRMKRTQS
jgi:hypothetical protein